jgi:putative phosphonate metabolism protein
MASRYAIYYAPEPGSALDTFGRQWLGRDASGAAADGQLQVPGLGPSRMAEITEGPRRYGMHGTLKPPFTLNPSASLDGLIAAAGILAKSLAPIEIPPLELDVIGQFVALTPETSSAAIESLAASCVRAFEGFRAPLAHADEQTYKSRRLTVHQEQMLEHWGYPYVMEEFQFHITLTEPIHDPHERSVIMSALEKLAAPVLRHKIKVRELTVFVQKEWDDPMSIVARLPFGRSG